jgi:hypothetical protein
MSTQRPHRPLTTPYKNLHRVRPSLEFTPGDIIVSFDIVSLFTKVPIKETTDLLGRHFKEDVLGLFHHAITTSYFTFNGQFYGQTDDVAMGSTLSPVIANFYMEDFEKAALESAPLKPCCWFCCVDDTIVILQNGPDKLKHFLHHLNSIHQSIYLTMETESDDHLPFLDLDSSLGHKVYRKPTHTNLYLNAKSHHPPSNKQAVLSTLIHKSQSSL